MDGQKNSGAKGSKPKVMERDEFYDIMISQREPVLLPGSSAVYLYSESYVGLDKLLTKLGKELCITEADYAKETKMI